MAYMCLHRYRRAVVVPRNPGDPLLSVLDYEGVTVTCSLYQWVTKIEVAHPDMAGRERDVADAVQRPTLVLQDRDYADRKHHLVRTPTGHWLKVVVAYEGEPRSGRVLTAFRLRRLRAGDTVLYPRSED